LKDRIFIVIFWSKQVEISKKRSADVVLCAATEAHRGKKAKTKIKKKKRGGGDSDIHIHGEWRIASS
jgi:hypothetical protein